MASSIAKAAVEGQAGIFELLQAEAAFTCSTDPNPIIATDALFSNVAIFGLEPVQKIAFGCQFHDAEHIQKCFNKIVEKLKELVDEKTAKFAAVIIGGEIGKSEDMVICARAEIAKSSIKMNIVFESVLKKETDAPMSLTMDTRDGAVSTYDEHKNPQKRTDYIEHMQGFVLPMTGRARSKKLVSPPDVKIAYFPFVTYCRDADEISLEMKNKIYYERDRAKKDKEESKSPGISPYEYDPNVCCIS